MMAGTPARELTRYEYAQPHMGTTVRIVLIAGDSGAADTAAADAFARIARLDAMMSDYRADSELMRAAREATARPVPISDDLFTLLTQGQQLAERTGGAFDVTAGPLTRLWRRARRLGEAPAEADLAAALASTGYRRMKLDPATRTLRLESRGMSLDLGGIAKGFAAEAALATLRSNGVGNALVAAGGDVAVGEAPPGSAGWEVAVPGLDPSRPPRHRLHLVNAGISTSGDAEQWVELRGVRYSHILDPRTGRPLEGRRSVTVVAPDATTSDMLATAVSVLGPDAGLRLVEETPAAAASMILEATDGTIHRHQSARWPR